jgi:hypothetical protein
MTIEASNDCLAVICTQCSMVRKATKRPSAIRQVGLKARQLNPAIAPQSAMVQVDLLVPPKHQAIRRHFATLVAERSRRQLRMVIAQRSARRAEVVWVLQVRLAITLPFATRADAQLDLHPVVELGRPFGTAQGVRRDQPATIDDEANCPVPFICFHCSL